MAAAVTTSGTGGRACQRGRLLAAAVVLATLTGVATARSIVIEDFDAALTVAANGSLEVVETIRLRFEGQWNGIQRFIPVDYQSGPSGSYRLRLAVERVTDATGTPLRVDRSHLGHSQALKIWVPGAADAVRTVVIRYRVANALRFFEDHDELYWNITGDEWPYPIGRARAVISLPAAVANVRANAFTGGYGSGEQTVSISIDGERRDPDKGFTRDAEAAAPAARGHVIEVAAARPLGIREGLTAAVAWNPGAIRRPTALERRFAWVLDNLGRVVLVGGLGAAPLVALGLMLSRWLTVGRDPRPGPVVVEYEPPAGLGPAEAGTLVDNSPDARDLMAMLVDCAVKRVIRIRETEKAGWFSKAEYAFELLRPRSQWTNVTGGEEWLLKAMFDKTDGEPGSNGVVETVTSTELTNSFYVHLPKIRNALFDGLVREGHYVERPDHVLQRYVWIAFGSAVLLLAGGFGLAAWVFPGVPGWMVPVIVGSAVLTALVVGVIGAVMPARTIKGARARLAIRGFEEFLGRVDRHRLATMPLTPELFEKYLPYAMALGVEGRWSKAFEGICKVPPDWYVGSGPVGTFEPGGLTQHLAQMGSVTTSAMQSAPRSESSGGNSAFSSGFGGGGGGGGGFSGGGFGGGGGSGF
jgi:uncharacterized membrane protein YgcG